MPADPRAALLHRHALVTEHLHLVDQAVSQLASRFPRHVEREELWNAGACGLVEAANRYRPETAVPFPHFAQRRIRGAIIDSTRARDWATRSLRRSLRAIRVAEDTVEGTEGRTATDDEVAERLGITTEALAARRADAGAATVLSLEQGTESEALAGSVPETDATYLPHDALEHRELRGTLRTAIENLPPVQREVVGRYFLGGELLHQIADTMGVTEARVSQLCAEAVNALRAYMATVYEGVEGIAANAPGKRRRASYVATLSQRATWLTRIEAADPATGAAVS
jgi:RNA polymerase sigma factor for flagellar operon FliA